MYNIIIMCQESEKKSPIDDDPKRLAEEAQRQLDAKEFFHGSSFNHDDDD